MSVTPISDRSICLVCGDPLPVGAEKCKACGSFQDARCRSCGRRMPHGAVRCPECKIVQEGTPCVSCGASMPEGAKRCPECQTFQDKRRFVPESSVTLALIVSLISVLSAVIPAAYVAWNYRSKTYVRILGPDTMKGENEDVPLLLVLAANNGGRPSFIRGAKFIGLENVSIGETPLTIVDPKDRVVYPSKTTTLRLTTTDVNTKLKREPLEALLDAGRIKVIVDVEETSHLGRPDLVQRSDESKGDVLAGIVYKRVPSQGN